MKKTTYVILLIAILTILTGCKQKVDTITKDNIIERTPSPTVTVTDETTKGNNHKGEVRSKLTGLWVKRSTGNQRPYAIMFNNIKIASPQSGTSEADILYEAIVEGGITRLMGIFEQITSDRIGSLRSARHYFVSFADEYDAIFVHYGQTKYATSKMAELGIDTLSGLSSIGSTVFYRDNSIKAPHNAFTSLSGLLKGTNIKKYETKYDKDYESHFNFYNKDTKLDSKMLANKVILHFSQSASPFLIYDTKKKSYQRFQFDVPHIDANTGKQLSFKNIIVQFVKEWNIDKNGYQTMDIEDASGDGYYITNGKAISINWKKNENTKYMRYFDETGKELTINSGKTYIAIFPNDRKNDVVLSAE